MAQFIDVPPQRLDNDTLQALLEEYASRDGTDYGERECSLEQKVESLLGMIEARELSILFDLESEQWDLVPMEEARKLLEDGDSHVSQA